MSAVELDNAIRKWAASTACLTLAMILNEARLAFLLKTIFFFHLNSYGGVIKAMMEASRSRQSVERIFCRP
ncbi:hypothetical protein TrispH2_004254 [Trichoplax sp. H2]|nr:hypothetical protein TrispH2_004254 [Trichoplax sp. H2]|eukprot:RDD43604.1 hypothetical protein TrispH2_004254 [Trichoplax sp. H2]